MTTRTDAPLSAPGDLAPGAFLSPASVRRICIDLIGAEQDRMIRDRRLQERHHIARRLHAPASNDADLEIGEEALGLDSLARLDLVGSVSRFFCLADTGAEDLLLVHRGLRDWVRIVSAHLDRVGATARIGFETSGSTGTPKRIVHAGRDLDAEVAEGLGVVLGHSAKGARFLIAVPPRHIYGFLWGTLLPDRAEGAVIDLQHSVGEALFRHCRPGDVVIGTPFTWERAARRGQTLPRSVTGLCSAGPSTPATWEAADRLGLDRLVEIYGSTETGGVGWRQRPDEPFRLSARLDRHGAGLRRRSDGVELALQDRLDWRGNDSFDLAGRRDDVVQVAGTNVSIGRVALLLGGVDGVAEAAVRLDGERLKALIVPEDTGAGTEDLEVALRDRAARNLDAPARPDRYSFAAAMPRNAMGKLADW